MPFEDDFAVALRAAADLAPDPAPYRLVADAERRARVRRSRRLAVVAGGLAVVVLAVGSFAAFGGVGADDARPATEPVRPMTSAEVVELVTSLLPQGKVRFENAGTPGVPGATGDRYRTDGGLYLDDGKGESIIHYTVDRTELTPDAAAVCMDPFSMPTDSCERTAGSDGSVLVIDKLRDRSEERLREWRATWAAADGRRVQVFEYNGQRENTNRENPPLDADQLRALVTAPAWERVFDALPARENPPKPPTPEPGPKAEELLAKLVPLLPQGAVPSGQDGKTGPHLLVTYEGRTSMLTLDVTQPGKRGQEDKEYAGSQGSAGPLAVREQRADGSLLVTNSFGNGKTATDPLLHWSAAVYYADGRKIEIFEQNGENGYTARPGQPALSLEQLKAIVTAPSWRS
ncbi:hypothetical protein J5Y04_38800 [Kitasatospora sp. RG8]|uniref:hypothetical protein n=1 Tax=Kitasatospora sp. RG8 TaxID=2820815 RepID=UPI001AE04E17|nr:hypothetical protein [Kitasatospora sp. RG8]MBP0455428.1 hypothetical protein [Kitasatospora sp. RG8]